MVWDDRNSPFIRFAQTAIQGKYDDSPVFMGPVRAMVSKVDKEERGVGMQNFRYSPAWDEFVHIVSIHTVCTDKGAQSRVTHPLELCTFWDLSCVTGQYVQFAPYVTRSKFA